MCYKVHSIEFQLTTSKYTYNRTALLTYFIILFLCRFCGCNLRYIFIRKKVFNLYLILKKEISLKLTINFTEQIIPYVLIVTFNHLHLITLL